MRMLTICSYVYASMLLVSSITGVLAALGDGREKAAIMLCLMSLSAVAQALYTLRMKHLLAERSSELGDTLDGEISFEASREWEIVMPGSAMQAMAVIGSLGALYVLYWSASLLSSGAMGLVVENWYLLFLPVASGLAIPAIIFNLRTWNRRFMRLKG